MRAAPSERDTSDLKQSAEELASEILSTAVAFVNTGVIVGLAHQTPGRADEASEILTALQGAVNEYEDVQAELAERGH